MDINCRSHVVLRVICSILWIDNLSITSALGICSYSSIHLHRSRPLEFSFVRSRHVPNYNPTIFSTNHASSFDFPEIDSVDCMEQDLFQRIQSYKETNDGSKEMMDRRPQPLESSFIRVIEHWLKVPMASRAENVLDKMEEIYTPSGRVYERIVDAWCFEAVEKGETIRQRIQESIISVQKETTPTVPPLGRDGLDSAQRALALLDRLEQLFRATGDFDFRPALSTYARVMNAFLRGCVFSQSDIPETIQLENSRKDDINVTAMLEQLRQRRDTIYRPQSKEVRDLISDSDVYCLIEENDGGADILKSLNVTVGENVPQGTTLLFNNIIKELANSRKSWAGFVAEQIFDYMLKKYKNCMNEHQTSLCRLRPDIITINECINAWAMSSDLSDSSQRAEKILEKLTLIKTREGLLLDIHPDRISYNTIIKAFANVGNTVRAEAILSSMEKNFKNTRNEAARPDVISYSSVLHAHAKASKYDARAAKKAEDILSRMYRQCKSGTNSNLKPTTILFNIVINALAERGSGIRSLMLLLLMEDITKREPDGAVRPDIYTYNSVLKAIARSKEKGSISRAAQLLNKMENSSDLRPDHVSYNTFIDIIAKNGGKGAGRKAEEVLSKMKELVRMDKLSAGPNAATYTSVINAWCNSGDKSFLRQAESIVNLLKTCEDRQLLDTSIYNALLKCACKNGSTLKAMEILFDMEEMATQGNHGVAPNSKSYTIVIDSISNDKPDEASCNQALLLLQKMEARCVSPNAFTYSSIIKCYAKSKLRDKAEKALRILQLMEDDFRRGNYSARPNIVAYNTVMNACAYSPQDDAAEEAFRIACLVFDEIRTSDYLKPTDISFATFLQVIKNLMPDSEIKNNLVEGVFRRCCRDGLCSQLVLKQLSQTATPPLMLKLGVVDASSIPDHWYRNIEKQK